MAISKNALLLFCKPPVPGLVKTRLTEAYGGGLSDEEAAYFFKCSLLDVAEVGMLALEDLEELNAQERENDSAAPQRDYDFFISTINSDAIEIINEAFNTDGPWSKSITYLIDKGASFDEHFDDAFEQIFSKGYDNVVAIGGDIPLLPREHLYNAFKWLDLLSSDNENGYAFVQAPCQQSGVSLIGKTKTTPILASGVYYNTSGLPALDAYTNKLNDKNIPNVYLSPVADVDNDNDLAHTISCLNAIAAACYYQNDIFLARRVLEWIDKMGLLVTAPPNEEHDPRQYIDVAI